MPAETLRDGDWLEARVAELRAEGKPPGRARLTAFREAQDRAWKRWNDSAEGDQ